MHIAIDFVDVEDDGTWAYSTFQDRDTKKRILVCHGTQEGYWPPLSERAISDYSPDIIYCCHPASMKRIQGDTRIQGHHSDVVKVRATVTDGIAVVTISRVKNV